MKEMFLLRSDAVNVLLLCEASECSRRAVLRHECTMQRASHDLAASPCSSSHGFRDGVLLTRQPEDNDDKVKGLWTPRSSRCELRAPSSQLHVSVEVTSKSRRSKAPPTPPKPHLERPRRVESSRVVVVWSRRQG